VLCNKKLLYKHKKTEHTSLSSPQSNDSPITPSGLPNNMSLLEGDNIVDETMMQYKDTPTPTSTSTSTTPSSTTHSSTTHPSTTHPSTTHSSTTPSSTHEQPQSPPMQHLLALSKLLETPFSALTSSTPRLKFRALHTKHHKPPNGKQILIKDGDEICFHFACFKLETKSLKAICIGQHTLNAGWESLHSEEDIVLFRTGKFVLKEVVDRDTYLGDKTIWLFEAEECIWYSKPYLVGA
jgi:hypothetical protein